LLSILAASSEAQEVRQDFDVTNTAAKVEALSGNILYLPATRVGPSTGTGVPVDGTSGVPLSGFPKVVGQIIVAVPDGAGGWFIGGDFSLVGGLPRRSLAHILSDNSVSSWDPSPDGTISTLALSAGRIYVGGQFNNIGGQARSFMAALDATSGNLDPIWDPQPANIVNPTISVLMVINRKVYVGGIFKNMGGQVRNNIAAVDDSAGLADGWDPNANHTVRSLAIIGNTMYMAGNFTTIGGQSRKSIAAVDITTGAANPLWDPNPAGGTATSVTVNAGAVLVAGSFTSIGGQARNRIAKLNATTGLADATWNPNSDNLVSVIAPSGSVVYVAGTFTSIGGQTRSGLAALDATTGLATAWDPNPNGEVDALGSSGGTVYLGGTFTSLGGVTRHVLAAIDVTTGLPTAWNPDYDGFGSVSAIRASGGIVYVGGSFTSMGGQSRHNIAALDATTGLATPWDANANGQVLDLELSGGSLYACGRFTIIGGSTRYHIARLDTATALTDGWDPHADTTLNVVTVHGGTVYAGGSFSRIGGESRNKLAALDIGTGLAQLGWDPNANIPPQSVRATNAIVADEGRVYVGGDFGPFRNPIASLDSVTGFVDTTWSSNGADNVVNCLALADGFLYLGGSFTAVGGQARNCIARLDPAAGLADPTWDPNANGSITSLALGAGAAYVSGGFSVIHNQVRSGLAAIEAQTVGVSEPRSRAPGETRLRQSLPNPTSTTSMIDFSLPALETVTLTVFDVNGRVVRNLLQGVRLDAGPHRVKLDARRLESGMYFYRLKAGRESQTRKMIVSR
jgi:hypothetical protein